MARWDEILSLPVQNPPSLEFSAADIVWSRVEGWRDTIDRVALIRYSRVDDFVRGESNNKDCPSRFHVEARRKRPPEMAYKPKVDGILEYILYWCSFGPDDHRKGGVVRPSRVYNIKKKNAGRPNTKRGCVCHFIVKRLIAAPNVALIIYNQDKHVDKKGLPCHGPLDKKAVGTRAMYAPYISDELRLRVLSLLYVGVPVETIMQRHTESVEKQGGPCNRDDLLTHRYVRRLERSIRRSTYELDADDAVSIGMWVENHRSQTFFYEDFSDTEPFVLGIQTEWQLQQMIRFGNRSLVASDCRFGTNKLKYPVHSLLVFDSNNKAIPVAWIITPQFASGDAHKWIRALYDRVHSKDPTWKLAGFIVDDPSADILTIREVFQCSVLICFWRVRHAWHKMLMEKALETEICVEILRQLGQAIYSICRADGDVDSFEDFMEDFVDCSDFLDYFKAVWIPRMGMWTTALKTLPLASQETCAAIEFYHHQLKLRLLNEKDPSVYQRADWLVHKLGTKVHSYYWLDQFPGKDDFARYRKDEWKSGLTFWHRAALIPDSDVVLEPRCAKVSSQSSLDKAYTVWNPGSEFAICECNWSRMGNLCKHVIKVCQVCRKRGLALPSISVFEYNRLLVNMLHCPPHDSLVRDHAVSLAVRAEMQLKVLLDLEDTRTSKCASSPMEQPKTNSDTSDGDTVVNGNKDLVDERQYVTGNVSSNSNGSEVGYGVLGDSVAEAGSDSVADMLANENDACGDVADNVLTVDRMDVDLVPTLTSPSGSAAIFRKPVNANDTRSGEKDTISENNDIGVAVPSNYKAFKTGDWFEDKIANCTRPDDATKLQVSDEGGSGETAEHNHAGEKMEVGLPLRTYSLRSRSVKQQSVINHVAGDNSNCGDVVKKVGVGSMMDVDVQSVKMSPCKLFRTEQQTINGVMSNNDMLKIGDHNLSNESQHVSEDGAGFVDQSHMDKSMGHVGRENSE